jgi:hypothetical protein
MKLTINQVGEATCVEIDTGVQELQVTGNVAIKSPADYFKDGALESLVADEELRTAVKLRTECRKMIQWVGSAGPVSIPEDLMDFLRDIEKML